MDQKLEQSILSAIIYFDIFDYPLTLMEIYNFLWQPSAGDISLLSVKELLDQGQLLKAKISSRNGFYFLAGREKLVAVRRQKYLNGYGKYKLMARGLRVIKYLPFVKMVAICNNVGGDNFKKNSDIDLFIVVASGRLYLTRLLVTFFLSILRLRRHGLAIKNRFCLSFYVTDEALNLKTIAGNSLHIYLSYWLVNLWPVYDRQAYHKFMQENSWVRGDLPSAIKNHNSRRRLISDHIISLTVYQLTEFVLQGWRGDLLEKVARHFQLYKMSKNKNSLAQQQDNRVVISDQMLKFHENDRRDYYENKFKNRLAQFI